ncbi:response regulator transcription factor [Teichococcus vastitatis]|jgi:DNA-binding NarL/FixJ family response regulator|uniref:DNA-binding response regulator n=1 Tax=Teichococcus vastitatis TaxID=2307076 RepID=A0ABS9VZU0_9PROT|nr:DNA-binding response regulator [Pseudoroseomonas vastitatis]MCI0752540.1 DNA-binding response regulator [Pseudoroseomonas vastitatis]
MTERRDIVLVVDDAPGTLGLLNDTLEAAGYMVLVAQSAAAAMTVTERITPDIVLMDAVMPGMDGFEACRRMKRNANLLSVPVIFMTGLTESEDVLRGFGAGGVDYVIKPVAPDEVLARIGTHLANARLTRSAHAALDVAGRFLLAADREGAVLWATPQAAALLRDVTPEAGDGGPGSLLIPGWVVPEGDAPRRPFAVQLPDGREVLFQHVGQIGPEELLLRVTASAPGGDEALLRDRLGLTAREAEVLLWLGRGKSNRDIAEILVMSPRTVNKHLEGIFSKLGVENRASAAALAVRVLGG